MTVTSIDRPATPANLSQMTAVEQARAVAEVQAAVVVANQNPRDLVRADSDMRQTCTRMALAQRAFYRVPNRGDGPSVHLARELARIWGNVQYGVHELRRDDKEGVSEIQAFAWDVQTNTRSTRTFIVPHERMAGGKRKPLTDLTDVYLNNQNVGARAVRECIFTVVPTWFTDEAARLCRKTLEEGEGKPIAERAAEAIAAFARIGVTADQLQGRYGPRAKWDEQDLAGMLIMFQSIQAGDALADDEFPAARTTSESLVGAPSRQQPQAGGAE